MIDVLRNDLPQKFLAYPHEKINRCLTNINQCLTDINQYLTDTKNKFYKILAVSVKYRLCRLNIGLLRFLP